MSFLSKIFLPKTESKTFSLAEYKKAIESGVWRNKLVFGISNKNQDFLTADPITQPNAFYTGSQGSGKTVSAIFTLNTHLYTNSDQTIYIICDAVKSAADYTQIMELTGNSASFLESTARVATVFEMVGQEITKRQKAFLRLKAENILVYDKTVSEIISRSKAGMSAPDIARELNLDENNVVWAIETHPNAEPCGRIVVVLEEFWAIPTSKEIRFHENYDVEGTPGYAMMQMFRVGRSMGITAMICTQRATGDDLPSSLKAGIKNYFAFFTKNYADISSLDLAHAEKITSAMPGRCAIEDGFFMQYPFIPKDAQGKLLKEYVKPFKGVLFAFSLNDYQRVSREDGSDSLVSTKPYEFLVKNIEKFDAVAIASRLLKYHGFTVSKQLNSSLVANLIAEIGKKRFAVIVNSSSGMRRGGGGVSDAAIERAKHALKTLKCDGIIGIDFDSNETLEAAAEETNGLYIETDKITEISSLIDNKDRFDTTQEWEGLMSETPIKRFIAYISKDKARSDSESGDASIASLNEHLETDELFETDASATNEKQAAQEIESTRILVKKMDTTPVKKKGRGRPKSKAG